MSVEIQVRNGKSKTVWFLFRQEERSGPLAATLPSLFRSERVDY